MITKKKSKKCKCPTCGCFHNVTKMWIEDHIEIPRVRCKMCTQRISGVESRVYSIPIKEKYV